MPRVEIPLIGPSYTNREKPLSAQVAKNLWPEINPEARNQVALHNTAGIRTFATLSGVDRGMTDFNNLMYAVSGQTLYSIDAEGTNFALGTIAGTDRVVMANDSLQLIIVTGDIPYKYTVANGVEEITDPDLVKPTTVAYLNNQFIFDQNAGVFGEFVTSSVDPDFSVDALDFAQAESHPDDIIAIVAFRQLVYMFGSHSVEPWQNTGVGNPPFARVNSGVQPYGLAGLHGVTKTDEFMYYLDTKRIPRRSNGLNHLNIGNPALGVEFAKYSKIDDVIAFDFVQDNQQFVAFTFPTADRTWCFHEPSGSWFELSYISTGTLDNVTPVPTPEPEPVIDAPVYIGPDINNIEYEVNVAITPVDTSVLFTGDDIVYSLTGGSWPLGITIDAATGIISGTPTGDVQAYPNLVVSATNVSGSADATAYQITILAYDPLSMTFNGTDAGYQNASVTTTGNKGMIIARAVVADKASQQNIVRMAGPTNKSQVRILVAANNDADTALRHKVWARAVNSAGAAICNIISTTSIDTGSEFIIMFSMDGDAGTAQLVVNGSVEDDTGWANRVAPTTGTFDTGASSKFQVGSSGTSEYLQGEIAFCGYMSEYLTNHEDFMDGSTPIEQDEAVWANSGFGTQPEFFEAQGEMDAHEGSEAQMTELGTVTGPA